MLRINELEKKFGHLIAVNSISFDIQKGEIFGLLGPNGAGKTTTINMICSLLVPDRGTIHLDGEEINPDTPQLRKKLGIVPQEIALYEDLNAIENLKFWASLYKLKGDKLSSRMATLLELAGLTERAKDRVKTYSSGMKRRLNMIAGLLHQPKLLLLDEPTIGIDPQARYKMLETVRQIANEGTTVLYTTHYLDEVENLCDRLAIMDHGQILALGTIKDIKQIVGENTLIKIEGKFDSAKVDKLTQTFEFLKVESLKEGQAVFSLPNKNSTGQIIEEIIKQGFSIDNLSIKEPSLDSVFIKLTGRELRD